MIITYKDFHKLRFPLYPLNSENWYSADGVLFLDGLILDEKKMPGKTLGIRRLQGGRRKEELFPLTKAILSLGQLLSSKKKAFIDTTGYAFVYQKTYTSKLSAYRIKRIDKKDTQSLLWLYEINYPITIDRPPLNNPVYARLLHQNEEPWILYDYVREPPKPTYRRV